MENIVVYDFTNVFNWFFNQLLNIMRYCYTQMDSITISGVSFLDISVTIIILGAILPIVLTFANSGISLSRNYASSERYNALRRKESRIRSETNALIRSERKRGK